MSKGKLLIISGPSGVGKGTIVKELLRLRPSASLSVSCTTRKPREGEKEGVSYFFITREQFEKQIAEGGLLEYSEHFGNYYGTPKDFVEEMLKEGDVILEIEVDGGLIVKSKMPSAILIMIAPPDRDTLYSRLKGRGTEDEDTIAFRLKRADYELGKSEVYDYVVVNDELSEAVGKIISIMEKEN